MKISKEKIIVIFYILYFTWLFTITYLTRNIIFINYFSIFVTLVYFIFLREKNDIVWFLASGVLSIILTFFVLNNMTLPANYFDLNTVPLWLPLAWGITAVTLKKFANTIMYS